MNIAILLNTLLVYLNEYFPQELDPSLKPKDSSGCTECRSTKYDFIIVGAGAAGCVLANRLSENPNWNILLIEAGGDEDYITDIPALGGLFTGTKYDWNYTTVKQEAVCQGNGGQCKFPLGYVMGGSSTIGEMLYMRGKPIDYDEWAESGNTGWSYKDVLPYFLKSEKIEIPALEHSSYHSAKGLLPVSDSHIKSHILDTFMKLSKKYGLEEIDYNSRGSGGISFEQATIEGGTRSSSSKSFLNPIRDRMNLNIFKNTLVTKVLFSNDAKKKVIGVSCVTDGQQYDVTSSKEVILSSGAINTPKLLMLSGIGPKKHLEEVNIPVIADLPVGENLVDIPSSPLYFRTNAEELVYDEKSLKEALMSYAKDRSGIFSSPQKTMLSLVNLNLTSGYNINIEPNVLFLNGYSLPDLSFNGGTKSPSLVNSVTYLTPLSRGTVKLKSNNYKDAPLIDPKYLSENNDLMIVNNLIKVALTYSTLKQSDFTTEFEVPSECTFNGNVTEEFLSCYVRNINYIGMYPMSTAKMGPASDKTAVVDSNLKVHGVDNLRVVDASVIPKPVRALPYATVDMIAEKASNIIQSNYE